MPIPRDALHDLSARLENGVKLGAILDDFPGALEARRHYETSPGAKLPAIARQILEHDPASYEAAELGLRISNAPLSASTGPAAGTELLRRIGEVIRDGLLRVADDQHVGRGSCGLRWERASEVDDLCVHGVDPKQRRHDLADRATCSAIARLSCWRVKCPTRNGSRRSVRRPDRRWPHHCSRSVHPSPR